MDNIILFLIIGIVVIILVKLKKDEDAKEEKRVFDIYMTDEFNKLYEKLYVMHSEKIEKARRVVRNYNIKLVIAILVIFLSIILFYKFLYGTMLNAVVFDTPVKATDYLFIIVFIFSWVAMWFYKKKCDTSNKEYAIIYKNEVIREFIKLINDKFIYSIKPNNSVAIRKEYQEIGFTDIPSDRILCGDYIEGYINENFARFVEINLQQYDQRRDNYSLFFSGMVAMISCKNINSCIKITKNKAIINKINGNHFEMDDDEFEKYFDVESDNKILATRILTSDIMEYLVEFYKKYGMDYEVVIKNKTMYIRFNTWSMFEPIWTRKALDKYTLVRYYGVFKFIIEFSKKIDMVIQDMEI